MTFATNLRTQRTRLGLSVVEAAHLCGITRGTWHAYENGTSTPTLDGLVKIAAALKTTASKLLRGV